MNFCKNEAILTKLEKRSGRRTQMFSNIHDLYSGQSERLHRLAANGDEDDLDMAFKNDKMMEYEKGQLGDGYRKMVSFKNDMQDNIDRHN